MKNELIKFKTIILPLILGAIALYIQLNGDVSLTEKEQNLVSALQFVSSIWLGWAFAQIASEHEFLKRQKKFAISAYRRIKEIEETLKRLLVRLDTKIKHQSNESSELDVIREIALSLQTTTASSKADWAEIIGDEIKALEEIEQMGRTEDTSSQEVEEKTQQLIKTLPESLKIQARETLDSRKRIRAAVIEFKTEIKEKGYIEFDGFWDPSFEKDIFSLELGAKIYVNIDDVYKRVGAFIAHTEAGECVGVITNKAVGVASYREFTEVVMNVLKTSKFSGKFIKKGQVYKPKKSDDSRDIERHYFKIRVEKS